MAALTTVTPSADPLQLTTLSAMTSRIKMAPVRQQMILHKKINILNSCTTQGQVEGWDAMKPLYYRSVSSKGAGQPHLTHHHKGWWNETKWMRWECRNGGMKFVAEENGRNPEKNLPRPRFVHHETHMEWPRSKLGTPPVGGERLTACATSVQIHNTNCMWITTIIVCAFKGLFNNRYDNIHIYFSVTRLTNISLYNFKV